MRITELGLGGVKDMTTSQKLPSASHHGAAPSFVPRRLTITGAIRDVGVTLVFQPPPPPTESRRSLSTPSYLCVRSASGFWKAAAEFTYSPPTGSILRIFIQYDEAKRTAGV